MKKEIISAILALTVVGGTFAIGAKVQPSTVVAQDSISELEQRQAELRQKSEQYQKELENYSDRRRRYRDIVEHLQLGASLIKR